MPIALLVWLSCATASPSVLAAARQAEAPLERDEASEPRVLVPGDWLVLAPVDARGRRPFRPDAVFARYLLDPDAAAPAEGETVDGELGSAAWERRGAEDGAVDGRIGYAATRVEGAAGVWLAELEGAFDLWIDGVHATGDGYGYGFGGVPVVLGETSEVMVSSIRGGFRLRFVEPRDPIVIGTWDVTRPDIVRGRPVHDHGAFAVPLFNASEAWLRDLVLLTRSGGDEERWHRVDVPDLAPLASVHVRTPLGPLLAPDLAADVTSVEVELGVRAMGSRDVLGRGSIAFDVRDAGEAERRTFVSGQDDSLQTYAVRAPRAATPGRKAVVLTLHGAGVDALGQARAYAPKPDVWILAPTNRRPYGFDWQDWGRRDAYEALRALTHAPGSVFLTGHSMGGHGAWHLAANDPDRFAAVAPSAGWRSFDTYGGRPDGELAWLWRAADAASDTEALVGNLRQVPTYVLHGADDGTVPVDEARAMLALLEEAGARPRAHLEEGAGHWWDGDAAEGADCVDWPGVFELFASIRPRDEPLEVEFTTVDPEIDADHRWLRLEQPLVHGRPLSASARFDAELGGIAIETDNVRRLLVRGFDAVPYRIDGQRVEKTRAALDGGFVRGADGAWAAAEGTAVAAREKRPGSSGPFKRAFDQLFVFVVGTRGDDAALLFERARSDQGRWRYRANAAPRIFTDVEFLEEDTLREHGGRSVILYGNRDTNAAWGTLVGDGAPLFVREGAVELGDTLFEGDDLCALFVVPRADPDGRGALVGAFAGTGPRGTRLGEVLAVFVSGVGYPDYAVFSSDVLTRGDGGVLAAGWFDHAWRPQAEGSFLRGR